MPTRAGLQARTHVYPQRLSEGHLQRVAMAMAMAIDPRVMIFDELILASKM